MVYRRGVLAIYPALRGRNSRRALLHGHPRYGARADTELTRSRTALRTSAARGRSRRLGRTRPRSALRERSRPWEPRRSPQTSCPREAELLRRVGTRSSGLQPPAGCGGPRRGAGERGTAAERAEPHRAELRRRSASGSCRGSLGSAAPPSQTQQRFCSRRRTPGRAEPPTTQPTGCTGLPQREAERPGRGRLPAGGTGAGAWWRGAAPSAAPRPAPRCAPAARRAGGWRWSLRRGAAPRMRSAAERAQVSARAGHGRSSAAPGAFGRGERRAWRGRAASPGRGEATAAPLARSPFLGAPGAASSASHRCRFWARGRDRGVPRSRPQRSERGAVKQQPGMQPDQLSTARGSAGPAARLALRLAVTAFNRGAVISGRRFTLEGECAESQEQLGLGPRIFLWLFLEYRHMAGGGLWRYPRAQRFFHSLVTRAIVLGLRGSPLSALSV